MNSHFIGHLHLGVVESCVLSEKTQFSEIDRKVKKGMNYKIHNSSAIQIFALGIITDTPDNGKLREFI